MSLDKKIRSRSAGVRIRKPNTLETLDSFVISEGGEGFEKKVHHPSERGTSDTSGKFSKVEQSCVNRLCPPAGKPGLQYPVSIIIG